MKSIARTEQGILITGASGFIGKHLCAEMERVSGAAPKIREMDVLSRIKLENAPEYRNVDSVVHLAIPGRVVAPVGSAPAMFATAIEGTLNMLECCAPRTLLLASTCATYGNTDQGAVAGETQTKPLGLYGLSRVSCEALAIQWAAETGNSVIIFRMGNVIGAGCGGLIPYLVGHAIRHPDGSVPARLRGRGQIIRDYVPVSHVVEILTQIAYRNWDGTGKAFFNLGTGRGKSNGEIAAIVTRRVAELGYQLRVEYDLEPAAGEARQSLLDVGSTTSTFAISPPGEDEVLKAVEEAVAWRVSELTAGESVIASAR